mmetsp:Transcript_124705/g.248990  ORF Transcript_124705/g.248990 Transcript_124705/m.248990 type:complete len:351 (-) Transcript_124705:279-1331(-)
MRDRPVVLARYRRCVAVRGVVAVVMVGAIHCVQLSFVGLAWGWQNTRVVAAHRYLGVCCRSLFPGRVAEIPKTSSAYRQLQLLFKRQGRVQAQRFIAEGAKFLSMCPRTIFVRKSRWLQSSDRIEELLAAGGEEGPAALAAAAPLLWGPKSLRDDGGVTDPPGIGVLADEVFDDITTQEASQGVICVFPMPEQQGMRTWATGKRAVVLDAVQDSVNIGVILRTMEAFEADTLISLKGTTDLYNPKVVRCSMGAVVRGGLKLLVAKDAAQLKQMLRGYKVFATSLSGDLQPQDLVNHLSGRDAFVFGNEARGVSKEVLDVADAKLRIRIAPQVDSLNVGVSVGIVLHAIGG